MIEHRLYNQVVKRSSRTTANAHLYGFTYVELLVEFATAIERSFDTMHDLDARWWDAIVGRPALDPSSPFVYAETEAIWFVVGETVPGHFRIHVPVRSNALGAEHDESREPAASLLRHVDTWASVDWGVEAACVEHEDCAAARPLGVACWAARHHRGA